MENPYESGWYKLIDAYRTKGYVIQLQEAIVSVVPINDFDQNFINKHRNNILVEKDILPDEEIIDFKLRMEEVAEKIRRQRRQNTNS